LRLLCRFHGILGFDWWYSVCSARCLAELVQTGQAKNREQSLWKSKQYLAAMGAGDFVGIALMAKIGFKAKNALRTRPGSGIGSSQKLKMALLHS